MEAKEIKKLLVQLAKGEQIANVEQARFIQEKLEQDADLRALLADYEALHLKNELHLLDASKSMKRIKNQALIEQLKEEGADVESKRNAAMKLVTDQDFRNRYEQAFPKETQETPTLPLRRMAKYTLRIAATLTLLIVAWWFTGQALVYNQALEAYEDFANAQHAVGGVELGAENQLTGTVCQILEKFDHAVENKDFIYIPDGGVRVTESGSKFGVKYYVISENECEVTVLVKTDANLPEVGERVSFDARAFEVSALGMSLRVLVEEQRHIVY
ncbi:MAG: hypothetical protein ACPGJS_23050 [Flammeovirgaceae bacterium]